MSHEYSEQGDYGAAVAAAEERQKRLESLSEEDRAQVEALGDARHEADSAFNKLQIHLNRKVGHAWVRCTDKLAADNIPSTVSALRELADKLEALSEVREG